MNTAAATLTHGHGPLGAYRQVYTAARAAQRLWSALTVPERIERLKPVVDSLTRRADDIVELVCDENGKPAVEAMGHEVAGCIGLADFLFREAGCILASTRVGLEWMPTRRAVVERVPYGVVLVITPWNFPLSIPFGQVLTALVAGNAVVLKPSEVTPRCGALVAELLADCMLPDGLLQVVRGDGAIGAALLDARPDKVLFTGSCATGRKVMAAAAQHPIPVSLELGGVDAMIVCDDTDLDFAASAAAWGGVFNGGQVCASVERVLVQASIAPLFIEMLRDRLEAIPTEDLGRITMQRQRDVYDAHLDDARARGLQVRTGGSYVDDARLAPTLITGAGIETAAVWREETFGPVLALATFDDDDEAVAKHNASPFGLTASVFSSDEGRALCLARRLDVGLVSVNDIAASLHAHGELPWGGVGDSGFGRSHGREGLLGLTVPRVIEQSRAGIPSFKRPWWFPYDRHQQRLMERLAAAMGGSGRRARLRLGLAMVGDLGRQLIETPRN